jgi:hypothetical protein
MVRINRKRIGADHGDIDIKVDRSFIGADQFLEITTAKNVYLESMECGGMKILSRKIFINGEILSSGPVVLAAAELYINGEVMPM